MQTKSGNIFDYLEWRGDISFEQCGLNVVDALIFSVLTYVNYELVLSDKHPCISLHKAYIIVSNSSEVDKCSWIMDQSLYMDFFKTVSTCRRFRNILVSHYVNELDPNTDLQFCAMTFRLPNDESFIAFRGTDNSMTGWKEDFNMSFINGTSSQLAAQDYVNRVVGDLNQKFYLGGHSKGGNLAVWSAAMIRPEFQDSIAHIYNNDGPGFMPEFLESENFKIVEPKIMSFVPESSIVGVLLSHCDFVTIKSDNNSVFQHDPFSWQVIGKRFVYDIKRTQSSKLIEQKIKKTLDGLSPTERSEKINEIFRVLEQNEVKSLDDFKANPFKHLLKTMPKLLSKVN